jgi:hypothetical protein
MKVTTNKQEAASRNYHEILRKIDRAATGKSLPQPTCLLPCHPGRKKSQDCLENEASSLFLTPPLRTSEE